MAVPSSLPSGDALRSEGGFEGGVAYRPARLQGQCADACADFAVQLIEGREIEACSGQYVDGSAMCCEGSLESRPWGPRRGRCLGGGGTGAGSALSRVSTVESNEENEALSAVRDAATVRPPVSVGVSVTLPPTVLAPSVIAFVSSVSALSFKSSERVAASGTPAAPSPSLRPARAKAPRASAEETRTLPEAAVWSGAGRRHGHCSRARRCRRRLPLWSAGRMSAFPPP